MPQQWSYCSLALKHQILWLHFIHFSINIIVFQLWAIEYNPREPSTPYVILIFLFLHVSHSQYIPISHVCAPWRNPSLFHGGRYNVDWSPAELAGTWPSILDNGHIVWPQPQLLIHRASCWFYHCISDGAISLTLFGLVRLTFCVHHEVR